MQPLLKTPKPISVDIESTRYPKALTGIPRRLQFALLLLGTASIAICVSQLTAHWFGISTGSATYRRIGPQTGPQVFCAGSSLLQFGISWPEVSSVLNQGIENWGVGGSSPEEWEISQMLATNANLMFIGVSTFDLNEHHLCNSRANLVPLSQTIRDLVSSRTRWAFAKRLLSQYPLAYLRMLIPTAGNSDPVLVGLRRILPERLRAGAAAEDRANAMVLPDKAILDFGGSTEKLSEWSAAKILRRLALVRSENRGLHSFDGPKHRAFRRMLEHANRRGQIVVVVMPVSPAYADAFVSAEVQHSFENSLADSLKEFPKTMVIRLDRIPALHVAENFTDLVHLNGTGRMIATEAFLKELKSDLPLR